MIAMAEANSITNSITKQGRAYVSQSMMNVVEQE